MLIYSLPGANVDAAAAAAAVVITTAMQDRSRRVVTVLVMLDTFFPDLPDLSFRYVVNLSTKSSSVVKRIEERANGRIDVTF